MDIKYNEIHVYWRGDIRHWCARAMIGDYGISRSRDIAISYAIDAMVNTGRSYQKIIVHRPEFGPQFIITSVKNRKPSSQFFQDDVP